MKARHLIIILFFFSINSILAQDNYEGDFSATETFQGRKDSLPIGTHKVYDEDEELSFKITYDDKGLVRKLKAKKGGQTSKAKFPASLDNIEWEEVTDGLWINKKKKGRTPVTEIDKDRTIKMHYSGYLTNGGCFDNSFIRNEPLEGKMGKFVKGYSLAAANMEKGEIRAVKIAPELGYGDRDLGVIPPNSTLIFYIYLLE